MTTTPKSETPDGNLPAALTKLEDAVAALMAPQIQAVNGRISYTQSRYQQLQEALVGITRERSGGVGSLPIWPDAFDLLTEIEQTVYLWRPLPATNYEWWFGTPHPADDRCRLARQLDALTAAKWRPQDCRLIDEHTGDVESWARRIDGMLIDTHTKYLDAACPQCDVRTVQRTSNAGELVNQPALQIDAAKGCHCLDCHTFWAPQYFRHLALQIGCPLPAGILE